jgi:hypothetical protein
VSKKNIYLYNILRSSNTPFDPPYSFLISNLLHLEGEMSAGRVQPVDFAKGLLETINKAGAFPEVDRVCVAISPIETSRLSVFSSHQTERLSDCNLKPGYSCFVSRKSSLLDIQDSQMRAYADIGNILEAYQGNPAQRSIRLLADSGVKSGLTLVTKLGKNSRAYLFLNSAFVNGFERLLPSDYSILCLMEMLLSSMLQKAGLGATEAGAEIERNAGEFGKMQNSFVTEQFTQALQKLLTEYFSRPFAVRLDKQEAREVLFPSRFSAYMVLKTVELSPAVLAENEVQLELSTVEANGQKFSELRMKKAKIPQMQFENLQKFCRGTNSDFVQDEKGICLRMPADFSYSGIDYSVVMG